MIRSFKELLEKASQAKDVVIGIPSPEDEYSLKTVALAQRHGLKNFILAGDEKTIRDGMSQYEVDPAGIRIIHADSEEQSAQKIVEMAVLKQIHVILKGFLPTAKLMKPVLDKEKGLRTGSLLSDLLIIESPIKAEGFLGLTDGGLNILPDLNQKKQIIENSVAVFHRLGLKGPKVGIMAAVEMVKEAMPATVDAQALTEMNHAGQLSGCMVYGPLALDIALSEKAAEHKGIASPVAGHVDIMLMPNIESGNLLAKSFTYLLKIPVAHVVMGAQIPVLITSRNESEYDKILSIALGVIVAQNLD